MKKTEVTIKRKLVINKAIEDLILFKENYQSLLTLYVLLAGEYQCEKNCGTESSRRNFF